MIDIQNFKQKSIGLSILHVDANHKFLENSRNLLQKLFDNVALSDNTTSALQILKENQFDILITDIEFADEDGIEFIQELKKFSPNIKIIVITAHDTKENLLKLISLGLFKLLEKPIHAPNLVQTLYDAITLIEEQKNTQLSHEQHEEKNSLLTFLETLCQNQEIIQLHNYYKGLSITNNALIKNVGTHHITFSTSDIQLQAIQYETKTIVTSELLNSALVCKNILKLEFNSGTVNFKDFILHKTSPILRKAVRVNVESLHSVALSINEHLFLGNISIADISVEAVKLELDALPAGVHLANNSIKIDINIQNGLENVVLNADGKYLREDENDSSYSVVFMLSYDLAQKSALVKYIAKRQMELIREFKRL